MPLAKLDVLLGVLGLALVVVPVRVPVREDIASPDLLDVFLVLLLAFSRLLCYLHLLIPLDDNSLKILFPPLSRLLIPRPEVIAPGLRDQGKAVVVPLPLDVVASDVYRRMNAKVDIKDLRDQDEPWALRHLGLSLPPVELILLIGEPDEAELGLTATPVFGEGLALDELLSKADRLDYL